MTILTLKRSVSRTALAVATSMGILSMLVFAPVPAMTADFFRSVDDLPLAPGLMENVDEGVEFDSPAGRIVTAVASGDVRRETVQAFYRKALPGLGWTLSPGGTYRRDGEVLTILLENTGKTVKLRIRVVPAPK